MSEKIKRKITVVLVDRANYGRLKPVIQAIKDHPELELQLICSGTMVLGRFGKPTQIVEEDGFNIDSEIFIELEGSTPTTMAKSLGFGIIEFSSEYSKLKPDFVLVIGDRYEGLAAALAASYMNICLAHVQGGEVSGSIDESARHCISKLAQFHFPATQRSADYLVKMGEMRETVFMSGCPSSDIAANLDMTLPKNIFDHGLGGSLAPGDDYILVVFHPVTTNYGEDEDQVEALLNVCSQVRKKVLWLWPNIDAGSDKVSASIRRFRELHRPEWLTLVKNFTPENYLRVLNGAILALGNSSSFVRDSGFLGTPVVLVGDRQHSREVAENVYRVPKITEDSVSLAVNYQLEHGKYNLSNLYGDGKVSQRIANHLANVKRYTQKTLGYVFDDQ